MTHEDIPERHGASACVWREPIAHLILRAEGAVTLPSMRFALASLEALHESEPSIDTLVIDALDVSRFGRGAVLELARWIPRNASWVARVFVLTRSTQLRSSVVALAACSPSIAILSESERDRLDFSARLASLDLTG
jgi:hypothetical protein